jgi:hypothetical protein
LPQEREEIKEVAEVCLPGGRFDNCFDRNAEEGASKDENKDPEDEIKHHSKYTMLPYPCRISA